MRALAFGCPRQVAAPAAAAVLACSHLSLASAILTFLTLDAWWD